MTADGWRYLTHGRQYIHSSTVVASQQDPQRRRIQDPLARGGSVCHQPASVSSIGDSSPARTQYSMVRVVVSAYVRKEMVAKIDEQKWRGYTYR